jgi:hypothetical protein
MSVICLLLAACQPHGPLAEIGLGWWHDIVGLEKLEEVLRLQGFQPELQDYISIESAKESVEPWRYKSDRVVYSYFIYPSREAYELRAVLSLSERTGRLRLGVGTALGSNRDACPSKGFLEVDHERIQNLALEIGERFNRKVKVHYIESERC